MIADFIARGLAENGYTVDVCHDGEEALYAATISDFDVIILDILIPSMDGIRVCRTLRECGIETPVLMLTARDTAEDRKLGLASGANDYLTKPFAFTELLTHIRRLVGGGPAPK